MNTKKIMICYTLAGELYREKFFTNIEEGKRVYKSYKKNKVILDAELFNGENSIAGFYKERK